MVVSRISGFAAALLAFGGAASSAAADIAFSDANLSLSEAGGRTTRPVVTIKFYENIRDWDATGLPAEFNLRLYLKVNVGSTLVSYAVHLPDPSNDSNARLAGAFAGTGEFHPRIVRLNSIRGTFPSYDLGAFTTQAIRRCRSELPAGEGSRRIDVDMTVTLTVIALPGQFSTKYRSFQFPRKIPVTVNCVGRPASQEKNPSPPEREVEFKLINATMQVGQFNRECPRRVAVRVTLRANMDRKVAYLLHRSDGPSQRQEIVISWQGGERYKGSFDHIIEVPKSRVIELWVEHKGSRVSGIRRIRVDCSRPWEPDGVYVE